MVDLKTDCKWEKQELALQSEQQDKLPPRVELRLQRVYDKIGLNEALSNLLLHLAIKHLVDSHATVFLEKLLAVLDVVVGTTLEIRLELVLIDSVPHVRNYLVGALLAHLDVVLDLL